MLINEIQEFAPDAATSDIMTPEAYAAASARLSGHVPGVADQKLENAALRQLSRFSRGVAQFIAARHTAGVVDDGDPAKIQAGLEDAIGQIVESMAWEPAAATETVAGIQRIATLAEALAGLLTNVSMSPANSLAQIVANRVLMGGERNCRLSTTGTSATVTLTADEIVVQTSSGIGMLLRGVSLTADLTSANLDTGSLAANTWYYPWIFAKADGTKTLRFSLSATSPTLPSGYTMAYRPRTALRTDGTGNMHPMAILYAGGVTTYLVGATGNITGPRIMASGTSVSVWTAIAIGAFVPPTAVRMHGIFVVGDSAVGQQMQLAPSQNYTGAASFANVTAPLAISNAHSSGTQTNLQIDVRLESGNIYWGGTSSWTSYVYCTGWAEVM